MSNAEVPPTPPTPPAPPPPPAAPAPPPPAAGPRLPWEERSQIGFVNALIETLKLIVTNPADAYGRLRTDGDYIGPIIFGIIFAEIGIIFQQVWGLLLGGAMSTFMPSDEALPFAAAMAGGTVVQTIIWIIIMPFVFVISLFIMAGIFHLCLMMVGALEASPLRFEGTTKVLAYAAVVNLANIVPFIGGLIALVGAVILYVVGFTTVHRTTQGKAITAVLIPVGVCCVCILIAIGLAVAGIMSQQ